MNRVGRIVIFTNTFPYGKGENFLYDELKEVERSFEHVVIVPLFKAGDIKSFDTSAEISGELLSRQGKASIVKDVIFFIKLAISDSNARILKPKNIRHALWLSRYARYVAEWVERDVLLNPGSLYYSYWLLHAALGAGQVSGAKIVSRAHGYDIYEERHPSHFIPFRRITLGKLHAIFPISANGLEYLREKYEMPNISQVHRLGTSDFGFKIHNDKSDSINFVSCSSIEPVKQVDKIFSLLSGVAELIGRQVRWIHIGDGSLRGNLEEKTRERHGLIEVVLTGFMSNHEVHKFYKENRIDFFINYSSSEGIPVSIMEAMSHAIPVIAPDIGGISEILNSECGLLLDEGVDLDVNIKRIAEYVTTTIDKGTLVQIASRKRWEQLSNASSNYVEFVKALRDING